MHVWVVCWGCRRPPDCELWSLFWYWWCCLWEDFSISTWPWDTWLCGQMCKTYPAHLQWYEREVFFEKCVFLGPFLVPIWSLFCFLTFAFILVLITICMSWCYSLIVCACIDMLLSAITTNGEEIGLKRLHFVFLFVVLLSLCAVIIVIQYVQYPGSIWRDYMLIYVWCYECWI